MRVATEQTADLLLRTREFWDAESESFDTQPGHALLSEKERWAWRRLLGTVFAPITGNQPLRVLDVGTGTGALAVLMANMGYQVTGMDLSPKMLVIAARKAELAGLPLTLLEGPADKLPFADGAFDVVFSRHLFWALPKPRTALKEWARVVRPGGMVAVADGWWGESSSQTRVRRGIGKALRRVFAPGPESPDGYEAIASGLPLQKGVSAYSVRYYLDNAGLERIRVRDLAEARAAEAAGLPLWQRIDRPRYTWLATGYRREELP